MKNPDWQKKRTMKAAQLKMICIEWDISQNAMGRYLGRSPRHLRRMIAGQVKIKPVEAMLINSLIAHDERPLLPE